jgi:hypothetical protein
VPLLTDWGEEGPGFQLPSVPMPAPFSSCPLLADSEVPVR